jgi:hypothetical protein
MGHNFKTRGSKWPFIIHTRTIVHEHQKLKERSSTVKFKNCTQNHQNMENFDINFFQKFDTVT